MKRNDDFLRNYKKIPRQAFSDGLYRRLSGQRSFVDWLKRGVVLGVMVVMVALGLSGNLLAWNGQGGVSPAADDANGVQAHEVNPALVGERGLRPREFVPTPAADDWLGPFDRPLHARPAAETAESREVAVIIVPAISR